MRAQLLNGDVGDDAAGTVVERDVEEVLGRPPSNSKAGTYIAVVARLGSSSRRITGSVPLYPTKLTTASLRPAELGCEILATISS